MANKLITAVKENKNDVRKKLIIATAVTVGVIATAVVLSKMKDASTDVVILSPIGETPAIDIPVE